jgi:dihydroorotase
MIEGQARFSLTHAMTSMVALGLPFDHVVRMVTTSPAAMLRMEGEVGTLKPGVVADVSVLADDRGRFSLRDNEGTEVIADRVFRPLFCLRGGQRFDADAPILPAAVAA